MTHYIEGMNARSDGTNFNVTVGDATVLKIRESDNQLLLDSGVTDDAY